MRTVLIHAVTPILRSIAALLLVTTIVSCGGGDGGTAPVTVASVQINPSSASVAIGATTLLTAQARDASGNTLSKSISWNSAQTSVATVSTSGLVTGVAPGIVTVTATADGISGSASITVLPPPVASVVVTPAPVSITVGLTSQVSATARDATGATLTGRSITWASSNGAIATVAGNGNSATITAVAVGSAIITALSEGVSGTVNVTVGPVPVNSVAISPATPQVARGATALLTATARDVSGAVLSNRAVSWTSSQPTVATVAGTGAIGTVVGIAAGTTQITASSEGKSATVTLTVSNPDIVLTRDTTFSGNVSIGKLTVPRGITVTANGPLVLASTDAVEIHGTFRSNCNALDITGRTLLVRGTISNVCAPVATGGKLTLRSNGALRLDSATVTSDGDIEIRQVSTQSGFARAVSRALLADTLLDPCEFLFTTIGSTGLAAAGANRSPKGDDGSRGASRAIDCLGHIKAVALKIYSQGGGPGGRGTSTPTQAAIGGNGGAGGNISVASAGRITFEVSTLFAQAGGKGGDATDGGVGTVKQGTGGAGGPAGLPMIAATMGIDVKVGGLDLFMNEAANAADGSNVRHGGAASILGENGRDASTTPATAGQSVSAVGGPGGAFGDVTKRILGDLLTGGVTGATNIGVIASRAGNGGIAVARAGDGGKGNAQFRDGAKTGDAGATGGRGGDNRVQDNTKGGNTWPGGPGNGGDVRFTFATGGLGYGECETLPWLPGGKGGDGGTSAGKNGDGGVSGDGSVGTAGRSLHEVALVGGNGGTGAGPGVGGGGGTKGHTTTGVVVDDGKSFKPGLPGGECLAPELNTRVSPTGGDRSHEQFGQMGPGRKTRHRRKKSDSDIRNAFVAADATAVANGARMLVVHNIDITGDGPWIPVSGTQDDLGNFNTTGIGTYAGFTGIDATYVGKLTLDATGRIIGVNGTLTIGANGKLPGGQPIIYTLTSP